jgi:hypothetical protein
MTRLTEQQIADAWDNTHPVWMGGWWALGTTTQNDFRKFVDRIAALAVQEVEQERDGALNRLAQLHAQLAEARESIAEEEARADAIATHRDAYRAQLATAKQEGQEEMAAGLLYIWRNVPVGGDAFHELLKAIRDYQNAPANDSESPKCCATPSGEGWTPTTTMGDLHYHSGEGRWRSPATPSPEAREPVILLTEDHIGNGVWRHDAASRVRITPDDAKRIVAMGAE